MLIEAGQLGNADPQLGGVTEVHSRTSLDADGRWVCLVRQRCAPKQEQKVLFQFNKSRVWEREPKGLTWILAGGKQPEGKRIGGEGEGEKQQRRENV